MARYLLIRLFWAAVTLFGVTVVTFLVVYRLPARPEALLAGPRADPATLAAIRERLKLDRPLWEQYGAFVGRLARGDLGESYVTGQPVARAIAERLPATAQLALAGWACWLLFGILLGVWAAARPTRLREGGLLLFSILGVSTPTFWVGLLLLYLFVSRLGWFPAGGTGSARHLVLPAAALAVAGIAAYARLAHARMRETLAEDFIRTAVAKGVPRRQVLLRHALRAALLPLATLAGADLATLLGGVVFTEAVFQWNGLGLLAVEAVPAGDLPTLLGVVLVSALFVVIMNLAVDLLYPWLDPRVRLGE